MRDEEVEFVEEPDVGWVPLSGHEIAFKSASDLLRIVPTAFATDTSSYYRGIRLGISVRAGPFSGNFPGSIYLGDLQKFAESLASLCASIEGSADFVSSPHPFRLQFTGTHTGAVAIDGEIWDFLNRNRLLVRFDLDQTFLPPILSSVRRLIQDCS